MKTFILHLMLVLSIAFAPLGQSIAMGILDMDMVNKGNADITLSNSMNCAHNQHQSEAPCIDAGCMHNVCCCCSFSSGMYFSETDSSLKLTQLSSIVFDNDHPLYYSQISLPLYRPPIA